MPKLIGHSPSEGNKPVRDIPLTEQRRLVKISYSQKIRLPQGMVFFAYDTSDRGGPRSLAKRWYRWYALPENLYHARHATDNMKAKALPKLHITW